MIFSSGGDIEFRGITSINIRSPINSGTGNIILEADFIDTSADLIGSGTLTMQPFTPNLPLGIGDQFLNVNIEDGFTSITIGRENSSGAITLEEDVTFDDPVILRSPVGNGSFNTNTFTLTAPELTVNVANGITVNANITTTGGDINLNGNGDNIGNGQVIINQNLVTNGGNIEIEGIKTINGNGDGVTINGLLNSGGGNISIVGTDTGTNNIDSQGISVDFDASIDSGGGNISLIGTNNDGDGIVVDAIVNSGGGNISISGTSNNQIGVVSNTLLSEGGNVDIDGNLLNINRIITTNGDITLTGDTIFVGPNFRNGDALIDLGNGDITLTGDEIDLTTLSTIQGTGNLQIQTDTDTLGISIGGTVDDARLNLNTSELNTIQDGFSQIIIGGINSSGAISLTSSVTFNDPVTLRSPINTGSFNTNNFTLTAPELNVTVGNDLNIDANITTTGDLNLTADADSSGDGAVIVESSISVTGGDVTIVGTTGDGSTLPGISVGENGNITTTGVTVLDTVNDIIFDDGTTTDLGTVVINNADNVTLVDINDLDFGTSNITGNLNLTTGGAISDSGIITVGGTTTLNATNQSDIILDGQNNDFVGAVAIEGNNVSLNDVNDLILSDSNATGDLNLTVGGTITQTETAIITVTGNTNLTTTANLGDVNLTNNNPNGTALDTVLVGGDLNIVSQGEITQTSSGQVQVTGKTTTEAPTINLNNENNIINDGVVLNSDAQGNLTITKPGELNINEILANNELSNQITGDLTLISEDGGQDLTFNGDSISGEAFTLTGDFGGNINITTPAPEIVTIDNSNPSIIQTEAITVTGVTSLDATPEGNITLTEVDNDFNDAVSINGNDVTLNDVNDLIISDSTINNNSIITAGDNITQAENSVFTISNDLEMTAEGNITQAENSVFTINNDSIITAGGNITQSENSVLTISNDLTLSGDNISQAENSAITVTGNSNLTTTADITLEGNNDFTGAVAIEGNDINLNDNSDLVISDTDTAGNLTATAGGSITQTPDSTITVGGITNLITVVDEEGNQGNITLTNPNNDFIGAVSIQGNDVSLNDINNLIISDSTINLCLTVIF